MAEGSHGLKSPQVHSHMPDWQPPLSLLTDIKKEIRWSFSALFLPIALLWLNQEGTPIHTKYISRYRQRKVDWNDQKQKSCLKHRSLNAVTLWLLGLPRWLSGNRSVCQWRRRGFSPGPGRSPGKGNGNSLQYSCLGNPMDRGAWGATVLGVAVWHDLATEQQQHLKKKKMILFQLQY